MSSAAPYWSSVFNTPIESGLRSTALLLEAYPKSCDIQRLVQYDYLIVHSGDVEGGPDSLHPATPHRSGELLVRRPLVEAGLEFMIERGVIERRYVGAGIEYIAGDYAVVFVQGLTSAYAQLLVQRARWVVGRFQRMPDAELASYMRQRWSQWGAEFIRTDLLEESAE